jgi:hypothetical protein
MAEARNKYVLIKKTEGKKPLERTKRRQYDVIKVNYKIIILDIVHCLI